MYTAQYLIVVIVRGSFMQYPPHSPQPQEPYQGQPYYPPQPQQGFQGQPQQTYYPPQQPGMYPPQQPMQSGMYPSQQPPKKKSQKPLLIGCGAVLAIVVLAIIIISAVSANASKSTTNSSTASKTGSGSSSQSTQAPTTQSNFKVGQVVNVANTWQITVLSAQTSAGSQYNTPQKAGDLFMVITVSVKNISSQGHIMSSLVQWNLQDASGQKYNIAIDTDAGATLDGTVAAGMPLKGVLSYEVPKTTHTYTLSFQNDITSTDQTIWDITV